MALNKSFLSGITPPVPSATAQTLLNPVSMGQKHKKETQFQLRIEDDKLKYFKEICEKNGTTMSAFLRQIIDDVTRNGSLLLVKNDFESKNVSTERTDENK